MHTTPSDENRIANAVALIKRARAKGDGFGGFDAALKAVKRHPTSLALAYHVTLQAARIGALSQASRLFTAYNIAGRLAAGESDTNVSMEDLLSLSARIGKDRALEELGPERSARLKQAANGYLAVFARTNGHYPLINAADLLDLAGDTEAAALHAAQTLALLETLPKEADSVEKFWRHLSGLEAYLVLGRLDRARQAAKEAAAMFPGDYGDLSTTVRQLSRLVAAKGLDFAVGKELGMPGVLCYAGHIIAAPGSRGRFPASQEADVALAVTKFFDAHRIGWAYGSLAAGADIMIVEAILKRGIQVHIVLPFAEAEFIDVSVRPSGIEWVERYKRCRARVTTCRTIIEGGYFQDDSLFAACSTYVMGLGRLQSIQLGAELFQLLVWDGDEQPDVTAGTAADQRLGLKVGATLHVIQTRPEGKLRDSRPPSPPRSYERRTRAMIFADVVGFSRIHDDDLPRFVSAIFGSIADEIAKIPEKPSVIETWGDAVFLVYDDVEHAAAAAMALLSVFEHLDREALHLPADNDLRVSGHCGSTFDIINPLTLRPDCLGIHVSRAARIEPITPPGVAYVSEAFAAHLALRSGSHYRADFVGTTKLAKKFGHLAVFRLMPDSSMIGGHGLRPIGFK